MAEVNEEEILDLCSTMEKLLKDITTSNIIRKANDLGRELIMFLTEKPEAINSYQDISQFIDTLLTQWVSNQNPKVSQNGMDALTLIAQAMQSRYKNYAGNILPVILTKLGDSKELSRDRARLYLLKTVEVNAHSASQLIEKLTPLLVAKNKDMSIEAQRAILEILIMSKEKKITFSVLNELVKAEVTCLNNHLREDAALILIDLAKRIGKSRVLEHLNNELPNTYGHHQKKIQNLIDDVRALNIEQAGAVVVDDEDELDFVNPNPKKVPTGAKPKVRPGPSGMAARGALSRGGSMRGSKIGEGDKYSYYSGPAGEADEAWFINAFKDAPMVTCVNHREFESLTRRISDNLQCNAEFWERKVEALKKIRSIIMHLKDTYEDEITVFIKNICLLLLNNLKDLRSQVVRETCLTFAFVCTELKNKVDAHTCEILMQQFMNNMISSTKVIASASNITMKFILLNVQHSRMINVLLSKITKSKSREVRTVACELLLLVVSEWPVSKLEQQLNAVQDGIRCGMSDSSVEGRLAARRAYWAFKDKFPVEGEALLNSMDASFKKAILSEMSEATDNSQKSTSGMSRHVSAPASARTQTNTSTMPRAGSAATAGGSVEDVSVEAEPGSRGWSGPRTPSTPRRSSGSAIPVLKRSCLPGDVNAESTVPDPLSPDTDWQTLPENNGDINAESTVPDPLSPDTDWQLLPENNGDVNAESTVSNPLSPDTNWQPLPMNNGDVNAESTVPNPLSPDTHWQPLPRNNGDVNAESTVPNPLSPDTHWQPLPRNNDNGNQPMPFQFPYNGGNRQGVPYQPRNINGNHADNGLPMNMPRNGGPLLTNSNNTQLNQGNHAVNGLPMNMPRNGGPLLTHSNNTQLNQGIHADNGLPMNMPRNGGPLLTNSNNTQLNQGNGNQRMPFQFPYNGGNRQVVPYHPRNIAGPVNSPCPFGYNGGREVVLYQPPNYAGNMNHACNGLPMNMPRNGGPWQRYPAYITQLNQGPVNSPCPFGYNGGREVVRYHPPNYAGIHAVNGLPMNMPRNGGPCQRYPAYNTQLNQGPVNIPCPFGYNGGRQVVRYHPPNYAGNHAVNGLPMNMPRNGGPLLTHSNNTQLNQGNMNHACNGLPMNMPRNSGPCQRYPAYNTQLNQGPVNSPCPFGYNGGREVVRYHPPNYAGNHAVNGLPMNMPRNGGPLLTHSNNTQLNQGNHAVNGLPMNMPRNGGPLLTHSNNTQLNQAEIQDQIEKEKLEMNILRVAILLLRYQQGLDAPVDDQLASSNQPNELPLELPNEQYDSSSRRFTPAPSLRSNSAIDLQAVQRAKARQQYAAIARQKVGSGTSLPRAKKVDTSNSSGPLSSNFGMERTSRTRSRAAGVSHSQPSSRSGSPSSRLGYHTYNMPETNTLAYQTRRNVPRSQGTSRETSPNRFGSKSSLTNLLGPKRRVGMMGDRPPIQPSRPVMAQKMLAQSLEAENVPLSSSDLYDPDCLDSPGHKASPRKTSFRSFEDPSDDSDASSLCSEKSFDSYRRTSDSYSWSGSQQRLYRDVWESSVKDITEIIANCESTHWSDRKEGLVALQAYLQASNTLTVTEIKRLTEIFTRMFMDSHTKVFSLFLDTLNELILSHKAVLIDWLYILLTRLLNKLGADLLGSIQNKILKSLDVVRESFPAERQLASVLRFLTDPTQTPNLRVKTAALNYVTRLAAITDPGLAFPPPTPGQSRDLVQAALHKMIGWTMGDSIKQGMELRRAAQEAILALFNLNTPQVTLRLANLPQEYQEAANTLLRGRVRRGSSSSLGGTIAGSPPSPSPRLTPSRHMTRSQDSDLPDIPNPEDVYRSLRKTTAEIQNYTYETGTEKPPEKANTTSKDSGISQLSGTEALEEAMEELSIESSSTSAATTILESLANRVLTVRDCNGMVSGENCQQDDGAVDEQEAMRKIVDALKSPPDSDNGENISIISESEKKVCLGQLTRLIRESSITVLQENFKVLLRILLRNLAADNGNKDVQVRVLVLTALTELIKKPAMRDSFNHYVELLILKVLNSYKDASKEVTKSAESCANTIAMTLAPSMVIRVLAPLIQTGEYPLNLAALKMLTKLVDSCGRDPVYEYLPDLMPGLIQAYDNPESSVRKSAVLCMVSLHMAIGEEELKPHLAALNGSKLKLLHVYILRSQQSSSTPTSPRNHPPAPPSS